MADKRRYRRFFQECGADFIIEDIPYRGRASDFSMVGLFINTGIPFKQNSELSISLHLPDGSISNITGLVRRLVARIADKNDAGIGIEIIEKDANYLNFINSLLSSRYAPIAEALEGAEKAIDSLTPTEETKLRVAMDTKELLMHLVSTQQALVNLLSRKGLILKKELIEEIKKLRK